MDALRIDTESNADGVTFRLSGDLDVYTTTQLRSVVSDFVDPKSTPITLDVGNVDFCDSQGISALMWVDKYSSEKLVVRIPDNHRMLRLFEIVGLMKVFNTQIV